MLRSLDSTRFLNNGLVLAPSTPRATGYPATGLALELYDVSEVPIVSEVPSYAEVFATWSQTERPRLGWCNRGITTRIESCGSKQ